MNREEYLVLKKKLTKRRDKMIEMEKIRGITQIIAQIDAWGQH